MDFELSAAFLATTKVDHFPMQYNTVFYSSFIAIKIWRLHQRISTRDAFITYARGMYS